MSTDPLRFDVDEVALSADRCIKCNVCNTVCPVLPVTDLFPGPKYCGPQAQRFRSGDPIEMSVDYCSGCGACSRACPSTMRCVLLPESTAKPTTSTRATPAPVRRKRCRSCWVRLAMTRVGKVRRVTWRGKPV